MDTASQEGLSALVRDHADILSSFRLRTITLGVNLLDCVDQDWATMERSVVAQLSHVLPIFRDAVDQTMDEEWARLNTENLLQTRRVTITPFELLLRPAILASRQRGASDAELIAKIIHFASRVDDTVTGILEASGVFLGGYSHLAEKGLNKVHKIFLDALPGVLANTHILNASFNVGTTRTGIDLEAIRHIAAAIDKVAQDDIATSRSRMDNGRPHFASFTEKAEFEAAVARIHSRCPEAQAFPFWSNLARVAVFVNAPADNPFMAGGYHGPTEPEYSISIGINGAGVIADAIAQCDAQQDLTAITQAIKEAAAVMYEVAETLRRKVVNLFRVLGQAAGRDGYYHCEDIDFKDGIVDLSLAATDDRDRNGAPTNSVAEAMHRLGVTVGGPGTLAALALLIDAVKKAGSFKVSYHGGLSGTFIPISEDAGMADALAAGSLTLDKYLSMTSVCSVGIDMVPVYRPANCSHQDFATAIAGLIADEAAVGVFNNKVTSARLLPVHYAPRPNRWVVLLGGAGLLGASPIIDLGLDRERISPTDHLVYKTGKIAPPLTSLRD